MLPKRDGKPQAVLIATTFAWGSTFVVTKDLLPSSPPLLYLSFRFVVAALLMLVFQLGQRWQRGRTGRVGPGFLRDSALLGLLQAAGLFFQVMAQGYTTASKAAFLTALSVPLTPVCGFLLRGDRPRPGQLIAVTIGAGGLLLLTYPAGASAAAGPAGPASGWNPGDLLAAACGVVYALVIVETAHRARAHDGLRLATSQTLVCAGLFCLAALLLHVLPAGALGPLSLLEARPLLLSAPLLLKWLYMAVVCTALTFFGQTWAMARISATESAVIFSLEPVVATVLGVLVYGAAEWPGTRGAIGAALVLGAVLISEVRLSPRRRKRAGQAP